MCLCVCVFIYIYIYIYCHFQAGMNKMADTDEGISSDSESPTSLQSLLRQITEKEQRILMLEADVAKVIVVVLYLVNLNLFLSVSRSNVAVHGFLSQPLTLL